MKQSNHKSYLHNLYGFDKTSMTKTQSGNTMLNTTDDVMSATRVTIWKELMRQKEEDGLDGSEHLPRATIR